LPEPFEALQPIIERFLAKDPQDRYPNATEARIALEKAYRFLKNDGRSHLMSIR